MKAASPLVPGLGIALITLYFAALAIIALPLSGSAEEDGATTPRIRPLTKTWIVDRERDSPRKEGQHLRRSRLGASVRLRYTDLEDVFWDDDLKSKLQFLGLRTSIGLEHVFSPTLRGLAVLNNESTRYLACDACDGGFGAIVIENLFLEWREPRRLPLGIRVGRQNLFYGDGFVISDGSPLDESRTYYVNGILLTSAIPLWSLDIFMAWDPKKEEYLPGINNKRDLLAEADEALLGIFMRRTGARGEHVEYSLEPYFINKTEKASGKKATVRTWGARLEFSSRRLAASGEVAYQSGKAPESQLGLMWGVEGPQAISAAGGVVRVRTHLDWPVPAEVGGGYLALSGDDGKTRNKFEGWNPVLGRWPQWSELFVYVLPLESPAQPMNQGFAYWQNLKAPFVEISVAPAQEISVQARYLWMSAFNSIFTDPRAEGGPLSRGNLYTLRFAWKMLERFEGHLLLENFKSGSFYPFHLRSRFLRLEASYSI